MTNTSGSNTLTGLTNVTACNVGQTVTGTGIPANTYITAISGTTVTLSAKTTAAVTADVLRVDDVNYDQYQRHEYPVVDLGHAAHRVVRERGGQRHGHSHEYGYTAISGSTVTLSANTRGVTAPRSPRRQTLRRLRPLPAAATGPCWQHRHVVGEPVIGAGIPQGTTVAGIADTSHLVLSQAATATGDSATIYFGEAPVGVNITGVSIPVSSTTLTLSNRAGLVAGESVNGFGINPGTVIAGISGNTVTLSGNTAAVAANTTAALTFGAPLVGATNTVSTLGTTTNNSATMTFATTAGLYPGMVVQRRRTSRPATSITGRRFGHHRDSLGRRHAAHRRPTAVAVRSRLRTLVNYSNLYSGGTLVDQGTLTLSGTTGSIQVPGDLTHRRRQCHRGRHVPARSPRPAM